MVDFSAMGVVELVRAMAALGMSTDGLEITFTEEKVGYPSGSYMNRQIRVTSGSVSEQYSAELAKRNPGVGAVEVQRLFGVRKL